MNHAATSLAPFGHHLIVGLSGPTLSDDDKKLLNDLKPAGILLLGRNFAHGIPYPEWCARLRTLLSDVRAYSERERMLITLDHEGGHVVRTPAPITRFPYASVFANRAQEVAVAHATELKSLGVNLSWAPCTDIHSNPQNPIIGARAFGTDPHETARLAVSYFEALEREGILGCAKHFPGHGDTSTDSHLELPVLDLPIETLRSRELVPFRAMIAAGVKIIMTAHIMFPEIDATYPATLSPRILKELLRGELGYRGVIVSDDLDMKAVSQRFAHTETLGQAFDAGCDMFIIARNPGADPELTRTVASSFQTLQAQGVLSEGTIRDARERIDALLTLALPHEVRELPVEVLQKHAALAIESSFGLH